MPDLYPHELRHTAASLAISSGADIKVVQQMLGHGSAAMTLDTYGHLFENRLDEVADAMDLARTNSRQAPAVAIHALPAVAPVLPEHDLPLNEEGLLTSITAGQGGFLSRTPNGIRTRATAVKGRRPRPLDDGGQKASSA